MTDVFYSERNKSGTFIILGELELQYLLGLEKERGGRYMDGLYLTDRIDNVLSDGGLS